MAAFLLRSASRLPAPLSAVLSGCCGRGAWRRLGGRAAAAPAAPAALAPAAPAALASAPAAPAAPRFLPLYRLDAIRVAGCLSRLKVAQTGLTLAALPPSLYWHSQGLLPLGSLCLAGGVAAFALAMLCWTSHFSRRLVGVLYLDEAGGTLRVAHLTFWGRRQDTDWPAADVVPLSETADRPRDLFVRLRRYGGGETFYLALRHGRVLDPRRFSQVFGTPDRRG